MKNEGIIDEQEIRKAIAQLKEPDELFEVRIIGSRGKVISGYFKNADDLLKAFDTVDLRSTNIYITLNHIKEECSAREQFNRFIDKPKSSTSDTEIESYEWLMLDFDPDRASGISATKEEYQAAQMLAGKVFQYLRDQGFEDPLKAVSGNGAHLLYKIGLVNNVENQQLVKNVLNALDKMFSTEKIKVDTSVYNPARICKLYGTLAQKGRNSKERPHRMSKIRGELREIKQTKKAYLEKICDWLPKEPEKPSRYNGYQPQTFDLDDFLARHGISYKVGSAKDSKMYALDECPFNSSHKNGDAKIFLYTNGAIAFTCHHNSCQGKKWQDVRVLFEPDAYEKQQIDRDKRIEEGYQYHNRLKAENGEITYKQQNDESIEPMFLTAKMVLDKNEPEIEYIPSGIHEIDKVAGGLAKQQITVLSGLRSAAKSTLLTGIILQQIKDGRRVIAYSGELSSRLFYQWIYSQAAGKAYMRKSAKYETYYCLPYIKPQIAEWLGDNLWLYNNNFGNDFEKLAAHLFKKIEEQKADLCVIDNMMALSLGNTKDKYDAQTDFVWKLKDIAKLTNTHIIFVAHPRKATGFLRLDDISGTGNIGNIVDNAWIIHRVNEDFKRNTNLMFKWPQSHHAYSGTNVIEICKDRENGVQDKFIPLYYEVETRRLKNEPSENIIYHKWDVDEQEYQQDLADGFMSSVDTDDAPF